MIDARTIGARDVVPVLAALLPAALLLAPAAAAVAAVAVSNHRMADKTAAHILLLVDHYFHASLPAQPSPHLLRLPDLLPLLKQPTRFASWWIAAYG